MMSLTASDSSWRWSTPGGAVQGRFAVGLNDQGRGVEGDPAQARRRPWRPGYGHAGGLAGRAAPDVCRPPTQPRISLTISRNFLPNRMDELRL
jgi:hypothetical protein